MRFNHEIKPDRRAGRSVFLSPEPIFAACVLGAACLAFGTHASALAQARARVAQLEAQSLDLAQRLTQAEQDKARIQTEILRFDTLKATGVIGQENRLAWSLQLKRLEAQLGLEEGRFVLAPRQNRSPGTPRGPNLSTMQWQALLLHEGRFMQLLAALSNIESAIVWPSQCTLEERASPPPSRLLAKCQFEWITLDPWQENAS